MLPPSDKFDYFIKRTDERFDKIELKSDARFDKLENKIDRLLEFKWKIIGGSALVSVIIGLLTVAYEHSR